MIGEIDGVKIIATPEQYKKNKKSLEKQLEEKDKEIKYLSNKLEIANNKLNMIKDNAQIVTPNELLEIIENYTGFFGEKGNQ